MNITKFSAIYREKSIIIVCQPSSVTVGPVPRLFGNVCS